MLRLRRSLGVHIVNGDTYSVTFIKDTQDVPVQCPSIRGEGDGITYFLCPGQEPREFGVDGWFAYTGKVDFPTSELPRILQNHPDVFGPGIGIAGNPFHLGIEAGKTVPAPKVASLDDVDMEHLRRIRYAASAKPRRSGQVIDD